MVWSERCIEGGGDRLKEGKKQKAPSLSLFLSAVSSILLYPYSIPL